MQAKLQSTLLVPRISICWILPTYTEPNNHAALGDIDWLTAAIELYSVQTGYAVLGTNRLRSTVTEYHVPYKAHG